ncbi:MAG: extracellular solute-binding protein [Oscillospiraceae bacterium]
MATMKDIAKAAGVSYATVSNVLNKKGGVSYEKIRLVEETAKAMGYKIDESARLLRKGKSNTIAVILPDIAASRYADLYAGIHSVAEQKGYSPRLYLTDNVPFSEKEAVASAVAARACGILAVSCCSDTLSYYSIATQSEIPVLFLERLPSNGSFAALSFDMKQAADQVISFLSRKKCDDLLIATENTQFSCEAWFRNSMEEHYTDSNFLENLHGELSNTFYLPFLQGKNYRMIVTSNEQLAESLSNASALLMRGRQPQFVTLSSQRTQQCRRHYCIPLNFRSMGAEAVRMLHSHLCGKQKLTSKVLPVSSLRGGPIYAVPLLRKSLRVVSLRSPSAEALRCLSPMFTKMTGIEVSIETYHQSEIAQQIQHHGKNSWDVIRMDVSSLPYWAPRLFLPLTDIDPMVEESLFSTLIPGLQKHYAMADGTIYSVPFDISVQMMFYRRDLYEDVGIKRAFLEQTGKPLLIPSTYEEYDFLCRFFTKQYNPNSPTPYGSSIALGNPSSTASEFLPRLLSAVPAAYNEKGRLQFAGKAAIDALQSYLDLTQYASPEVVRSWGEVVDNFVDGQISAAILFLNHAARVVQAQDSHIAGMVGYSTIPGKKPLLGGGALGISRFSQQSEQAYQFIRWAVSEKIASELMMMGGISPCLQPYQQRRILEYYPWLSKLQENIAIGGRKNVLFQWEQGINQQNIEIEMGKLIGDAVRGKRTAEETIWRMQFLINEAAAQEEMRI